ncbi:hypothetical protein DPMN_056220 [Dreissena polymorpha]|uniref:Uncharacterized protein n=1 Tax=Dreissena polymorpha TaxID=45954 RepID=A0A9D4HSZ2_DREPO|nr:hypothetical protein DPMN_056220 [Dreissena polymorpha]
MVSKQLAGVGLCLDDESHPLYLTPSELNQTCQNVHSLLKMRDEKADKQYHLQKMKKKKLPILLLSLYSKIPTTHQVRVVLRIRTNAKLLVIPRDTLSKNLRAREMQNKMQSQVKISRLTL